MIKCFAEKDRVILDLCGRRSAFGFDWRTAEPLVIALRDDAARVEDYLKTHQPSIATSEWDVKIQSYDGGIWFQVKSSIPGAPDRIPMPPEMARKMADRIEFVCQQAAYRMRFEFARTLGGPRR